MRSPQGVHGAILGVDLQGYSRPGLSESDRSRLRDAQQQVLHEAIATVAAPESCAFSDTGDGMLAVFPAATSKKNLVIRVIPTLEQLVLEHNHASADHLRLRMRVVLHQGEVVIDRQRLTGDGIMSNDVNVACRLLDCEPLRRALRRSADRFPLALLVSDAFYKNVILGQLVIFRDDYERHEVSVKGQSLIGWLRRGAYSAEDAGTTSALAVPPVEQSLVTAASTPVLTQTGSGAQADDQRQPRKGPQQVTLADLARTCVYVSTADLHNYNLYEAIAGRVPLANHMETALLLGTHTIMHCADPYRSEVVCGLIEHYRQFVDDGSILFLLTAASTTSGLLRKAVQFVVSGHAEADIDSFSKPWDAPGRAERATELIDRSPFRLYRGYRGTARFVEAVRSDLNPSPHIILSDYALRWTKRLNLTLFQLLHLERRTPDGRVVRVFADDETLHGLMEELELNLERHSFSRQIFLSVLQEHLGKALPTSSAFYRLFAARISLLHLQINVGPHAFIECTPTQDADSSYHYEHLLAHLGCLSG
jgi:class 3 adenylate cyclase